MNTNSNTNIGTAANMNSTNNRISSYAQEEYNRLVDIFKANLKNNSAANVDWGKLAVRVRNIGHSCNYTTSKIAQDLGICQNSLTNYVRSHSDETALVAIGKSFTNKRNSRLDGNNRTNHLSKSEQLIVGALATRWSLREVAVHLNVTPSTVHLAKISVKDYDKNVLNAIVEAAIK